MDPQTEQGNYETSKNDHQAPRRTLDKTHLQLEPSHINQAEKVSEARKAGQEMGRRQQRIPTTNQRLPAISRTTRLGSPRFTMARDGTPRKATLRTADSNNQYDPRPPLPRQRQPNQQHSDKQRTRLKPTTSRRMKQPQPTNQQNSKQCFRDTLNGECTTSYFFSTDTNSIHPK